MAMKPDLMPLISHAVPVLWCQRYHQTIDLVDFMPNDTPAGCSALSSLSYRRRRLPCRFRC